MPDVAYPSAGSQQMWFEDTATWDGMAGVALYSTAVEGVWELAWWLETNGYGESYSNVRAFDQNYVYFRLKMTWDDPDMTVQYFYSRTEPTQDSDWIELGAFSTTTPYKPTGQLSLYLSGNPDGSSTSRVYLFDYFRQWGALRYDEFNDGEVAPFWLTRPGWSPPTGEQDGYVYKDHPVSAGNMDIHQAVTPLTGPFDVWTKVDFGQFTSGVGNSLGFNFGWLGIDWWNPPEGAWYGTHSFFINWAIGDYYDFPGPEGLYVGNYSEVWNHGQTSWPAYESSNLIALPDAETIANRIIYVRIKWKPQTTTTRFFWSLIEPRRESDWIEFVWDAPQDTFDYYQTDWLDDGECCNSWDEMRAILRTVDQAEAGAALGFYMWVNNEYVPNIQKVYFFRKWGPSLGTPVEGGGGWLSILPK